MAKPRYRAGMKRSPKRPAMKMAGRGRAVGVRPPGAPGSAPGGGAATAPPPGGQGIGIDPAYDAAMGAANRGLGLSQADIDQARGQLGSSYGLGINAQGSVFDDPSNPFSRAAVLAQSYRNAQRGTTNSMAARGQLYAGSLQNAQNENTNVNQRNRDSMIREFMSANQSLTNAGLRAQNDYAGAVAGAGADRVNRALDARPDPASVPQPAAPKGKPKAGYQFVASSGPYVGMSYKLVPGPGGTLERLFENGKRQKR